MSHLKTLLKDLAGLQLKAEYWDVRIEDTVETNLLIQNGEVTTCSASPSLGAFVRVRKNGFWLLESTTEIASLRSTLEKLDRQEVKHKRELKYSATQQPAFERISHAASKFSAVPVAKKLALLQECESFARSYPRVANTAARYKDVYKVKAFLNSVGTRFEYDFNQAGFACVFTLKDGDKLFDDKALFYAQDFAGLEGKMPAIRASLQEAEKFIHAPAVAPGKYKVLLDPMVTGVFTHESFGHKSEADFILGDADALAEWKIGKKIASDCLTIVDCGTHAETSGYCPIDDEGTPARKNYLIKEGALAGRLHSRETAGQLSEEPTGNARAMNFEFEPIVRMTSTYIEAGKETLDELLARSEGAILVNGVKHGSGLSTFTIAPHRGYRIGKGGVKEPVRVSVISGSVFETLKNIEAVSDAMQLDSSALGGCGKMEQWPLPVAYGGPYVLVKEMQVS